MLDTVDQLREHVSNQVVVADKLHWLSIATRSQGLGAHSLLVGDHGEQVSVLAPLHDDIGVVSLVDGAIHAADGWVVRR